MLYSICYPSKEHKERISDYDPITAEPFNDRWGHKVKITRCHRKYLFHEFQSQKIFHKMRQILLLIYRISMLIVPNLQADRGLNELVCLKEI